MPQFKHALCLYPYRREVPIYEFFPPIGLEYIARVLKEKVPKVELFDARQNPDSPESIPESVDLVCVSVNWRYDFDSVMETINALPEHAVVIVGGREATVSAEEILNRCPRVAAVVRGEGEETVHELLSLESDLRDPGVLKKIEGISFRNGESIVHNPSRPLCEIDDNLEPARELRAKPYRITFKGWDIGTTFDAVLGSRGCPYNCKFCSFKMNPLGQRRTWTPRDPAAVVREIAGTRADIVAFIDDNFFADEARAEEICDRLTAEKLKTKFLANARIEIGRNERLVRKLESAGFVILNIGIESAVDRTLKMLGKGFTTSDVAEAMRSLARSRVLINGYFIIGNIGETDRAMLSIVPFARRVGLDIISLNRLRYEKHSRLGELIDADSDVFVGPDGGVYSSEFGKEELTELLKKITLRFYDAPQVLRIMRKSLSNGFIKPRQILNLGLMAPWIALRVLKGHYWKKFFGRPDTPVGHNGLRGIR
ncbi:MAG: B12-binding domain-containing radical SAM protein [Planctomycetota bacterium]|nr:MAG: B12-binding domain-containing radical SAM protein [Planctomycetota bacterium]